MTLHAMAFSTGLSFAALFLMFRPLEIVFAARRQKFFRPGWFTDLCFFLGQYLLWSGLVLWFLLKFGGWVDGIVPARFRAAVTAQAIWIQAIEVVLLSDFFIYWGHRFQHRVGFLWRFHSIHHSAEHLDWLAAHREHPIDTIYTMGLINLPAFVMGFPLQTIALLMAFRGLWAIYIHSNVRLPIGVLRVLIGAPELHHWHHDRDREAGNYANISPLMDVIFGTYRCPDHEPEAFGISEPISRNYLGQMLHPFLPRKQAATLRTPVAGPGIGEPLEAEALEDGSAGGEGVNLQEFGAAGEGVAGAGGDEGAVVAAAAKCGQGLAAVEAGKPAVGVRVEPAGAHGLGAVVGDVDSMMR
jgi:sterol desaturase/sphingolipid hydroxylase (fatty acid hydroxylase superfamily)